MTKIMLALAIGGAFGFVLDRIGATNPNLIIGMLRLSKLHLMKTILLAIGVGSTLMFGALLAGLLDPGHLSVKTAHMGVLLGGILLGVGFAAVGYCPGTGLAAAATGRKDAMFFVAGGLAGAAAFMGSYAWVKSTGVLTKIAGGKATLASIEGTSYPSLMEGVSGAWLGILLGITLIVVAVVLPDRLRGASDEAVPADSASAR